MPCLYDIDLDFFYSSERPLFKNWQKKLLIKPESLFKHCKSAPFYLHIEHREALEAWDIENLSDWDCWHFDAHADFGGDCRQSPYLLPPGKRADYLNSSNFLFAALREGIFKRVVWVLPPWISINFAHEEIQHIDYGLRERITFLPWESAKLPRPDRVDISFSPVFTPFSFIKYLGSFLPEDDFELSSLIEKLLRGRMDKLPDFYLDRPSKSHSVYLYHGSPISGLKQLKGDPLYLSPSPAVAACYGFPLSNEDGWIHGIDYLSYDMPVVYVVIPPQYEYLTERPMTLYLVDGGDYPASGSLYGYERIAHSCDVVKEINFDSARLALAKYGVDFVSYGEERIAPCLRRAAKEVRSELEAYMKMPLEAILALPCLEASLLFFFVGKIGMSPRRFEALPPRYWRHILDRTLLPMCEPLLAHSDGEHGLEHARQTALFAGILAWQEGVSPIPAMLASCLHDAARIDDLSGEQHTHDSAIIADAFLKSPFGADLPLTEQSRSLLLDAIKNHTQPSKTNNPVAACLHDADRLRVAWENGVKEECFSTESGLHMAKAGKKYAHNYSLFLENLGTNPFECKIEITENCNLAYSFCHQGFGHKHTKDIMPLKEFQKWIDRCVDENINMLHITGGEPLLVDNLVEYLEYAEDRGFLITLNTNAIISDANHLFSVLDYVSCLKISLPAANEKDMRLCTGVKDAFLRKLEVAAEAAEYRTEVEFLTPMFPEAINKLDEFAALLEEMSFVVWKPLRAESTPLKKQPVNRDQMLQLTQGLQSLKQLKHWEDLQLYLSMPFCFFDNPWHTGLLHGRTGSGPYSSIVIDVHGRLMRCYSHRQPLDASDGLRAAAMHAACQDFEQLPELCKTCPVVNRCLGGCRCPAMLTKDGFDYLARPEQARLWQKRPMEFLLL